MAAHGGESSVALSRSRAVALPGAGAAVGGLVLVAAVLRFAALGDQSFWYDEAITLELCRADFGGMLSGVHAHEATPPLYFALAWLWTRIFGYGEVGLRSLSAVVGTATVPVAYLAARDLVNRRVGLIAALLVAIGPPLVAYSLEGRSYALMTFLCAVALLFFVRALQEPSTRNYGLWALAAALALVTHYFSLFVLVPEAVWLLARGRDRRRAAIAIGVVAAAGVALLPLALYQRVHGGGDWISTFYPLGGRIKDAARFFVTGLAVGNNLVTLAGVLAFAAAVALVAWRAEGRYRSGALLALGIGGAAVLIPIAGALVGADYVLDRNLLPAWVPLAIVLAAALGMRRLGLLALVAGLVVCAVLLRYDYKLLTDAGIQRDDWRGVARALGPARSERAISLSPFWEMRALRLYLPNVSFMPRPARVREIDTIAYHGNVHGDLRGRTPVPGPPFRRVASVEVQRMTVVRYLAPRPVLVQPGPLVNLGRPPFLQRPRRR